MDAIGSGLRPAFSNTKNKPELENWMDGRIMCGSAAVPRSHGCLCRPIESPWTIGKGSRRGSHCSGYVRAFESTVYLEERQCAPLEAGMTEMTTCALRPHRFGC